MFEKELKEHILVCLNSAPSNEHVVKSAIKLAREKNARLTALYVETKLNERLDKISRKQLDTNIQLAENAGANVVIVYGNDIAYQISEYAKVSDISTIIIGHTNERHFINRPKRLVDRLLNDLPDIEIYIIPYKTTKYQLFSRYHSRNMRLNIKDILFSFFIVLVSTILGIVLDQYLFISDLNILFFYILGVLLISTHTNGKLYGILSSILGALIYTFLFPEPKYSFQIAKIENTITLMMMLIVSIVTSTLTTKVKIQANKAVTNSYRTSILFELSQAIAKASTLSEIITVAQKQIYKLIQSEFILYILNPDQTISSVYICEQSIRNLDLSIDKEELKKVLETKNKIDTKSSSYIPLLSDRGINAIIELKKIQNDREQESLLYAMIHQIAIAIERYQLNEVKNQALIQVENERYRLNMFRALSHDLRTPLTGITGSAKSILSNQFTLDTINDLVLEIYDDSIWLTNMVENLLFLSKVENEKMLLNLEPQLVEEIIDEAIHHIHIKDSNKLLIVEKMDPLLMVNADVQLIIQVIINLINNAIYHSNSGQTVKVSVESQKDIVLFSISDDGDGISEENKLHMFEMFFSLDKKRRGLGLGLALCKMIVEAHKGHIYVENNIPKGTIFKFSLPKVEVKINEEFNFNRRG